MSTLFLIGNGFDVNCGMRTKYKDVYEGYVKTESSSDAIMKFKKDISSNIENWGDFEMAMAKYAECLADEKQFLECIRDFSNYMESYLSEEELLFKKKLSDRQINSAVRQELSNSLSKFCYGISHNIDDLMDARNANHFYGISIITFNYTDVFDMIINEFANAMSVKRKEIIHIHGVLKDGPVFGVDNIKQIVTDYKLSRRGERGFIKPIFNESFDKKRVQVAKDIIKKANTICVYGMSLGDSDLSWRNELIEWLKANKDNHLFLYQYNLAELKFRTVSEKLDIEETEKESLLIQWGIEKFDTIFDQIHIPCGRNIFNIKNAIEVAEEKKRELENEKKKIKERLEMGEKFISEQLPQVIM